MKAVQKLLLVGLLVSLPLGVSKAQDAAAIYAEKCAACHGDMARFAQRSLCLDDTLPVLREGGERLENFLANHGRLRPEEIKPVCDGMVKYLELPKLK